MIHSQAGLALECLLGSVRSWDGYPLRHLFCYNGECADTPYECGCCFLYPGNDAYRACHCLCHERIERMARSGDMPLLVFALMASGDFPRFPSNIEEEASWRKQALEEGRTHYHNTNGRFANYSKLVCSTCCPSDDRPQVKYDTKTGKELPLEKAKLGIVEGGAQGGPSDVSPGVPHEGEWLVPHVSANPKEEPDPHEKANIQTPEDPPPPKQGGSEYVWKPGRCT